MTAEAIPFRRWRALGPGNRLGREPAGGDRAGGEQHRGYGERHDGVDVNHEEGAHQGADEHRRDREQAAGMPTFAADQVRVGGGSGTRQDGDRQVGDRQVGNGRAPRRRVLDTRRKAQGMISA